MLLEQFTHINYKITSERIFSGLGKEVLEEATIHRHSEKMLTEWFVNFGYMMKNCPEAQQKRLELLERGNKEREQLARQAGEADLSKKKMKAEKEADE